MVNKKTVQGHILKLALLTHNNISGTSVLYADSIPYYFDCGLDVVNS